MTINLKSYKIGDKTYFDKDPDNKWTYVVEVTNELVINNQKAVGVTGKVDRMLLTKGPTLQYDIPSNRTFIKFQASGPTVVVADGTLDASITFTMTADGDGDTTDMTVYFKGIQT